MKQTAILKFLGLLLASQALADKKRVCHIRKTTTLISSSILPTTTSVVVPTVEPTVEPTISSTTVVPTVEPTVEPTISSTTVVPTVEPPVEPTISSTTVVPTVEPTVSSTTVVPTVEPTVSSTTVVPTVEPTVSSTTVVPTVEPTVSSTTVVPTVEPTVSSTTIVPTVEPTASSTTIVPTVDPTTTTTVVVPTESPVAPKFQYYYGCVDPKHWAMTYDDGPYTYDNAILDLLKEYNIKATFFLCGNLHTEINTPQAEATIKRMYEEGHLVENHTYNHLDLTSLSPSQIKDEVLKVEDGIFKYTGKKPAFVRPPYGSGYGNTTLYETMDTLGYTAGVIWNADVQDWGNEGSIEYALARFTEQYEKGESIISLNHLQFTGMTEEKIVNLAKAEIEFSLSHGYTPVTMDVCLGLKPYKE